MVTSHRTATALALLLCAATAHAGTIGGGPHGGMSTGAASPGMMGMSSSPGTSSAAGAAAASQGGQGGRYMPSMVDGYQPWPEAEMRRFEKPRWEPYAGN